MVRRPAGLAALADFLHQFFDDVDVLFVLRRGDYWLPSSYAEYVTSGGSRPLDAAFVRRREPMLRVRRLLRRWERAFGPGSVKAVPFLEADKANPVALPARILR